MREKRLFALLASALFGLGLVSLPGAGVASPTYSGTMVGTFSDVLFSGLFINSDGSTGALDNTASAVVSGVGTNQIAWGRCDLTCGSAPPQSTVTFTGASFTNMAPDVVFQLGTLDYINGASFSNTLIFGATLSVGVDASTTITPGVAQIGMLSTVNSGVDPLADADFLGFDVLPVTFHVLEGAAATADVYGYIHGDPQVVFGYITLSPGQDGNGFLAIPEPASLALLALGLAGIGFSRRKRQSSRHEGTLASDNG